MARKARCLQDNSVYRIIARFAGGVTIFSEHSERIDFFECLETAGCHFRVAVHGFRMDDAGVDLTLFANEAEEISRFMQWLMSTFSRRHRVRHDKRGKVWRDRYRSEFLESA